MVNENIIIGRNTVREALKSGRSIEAIYLAEGSMDGSLREIHNLAKQEGVVIKNVPRGKLDELSREFGYGGRPGNHQGVAALLSGVKYAELEDIFALAEQRGEPPFIVALDGVTDPQNVGAVVRSAEVLGAHGLLLLKRRSTGMNAVACKVASGAEEYLPIVRVSNLPQTIEVLKERGLWVAVADMEGVSAYQADLTGPLLLVIGAEGKGVSRLVREKGDFIVKIDVKGRIDSLNAAAAAAVLFYEKMRQDAMKKG